MLQESQYLSLLFSEMPSPAARVISKTRDYLCTIFEVSVQFKIKTTFKAVHTYDVIPNYKTTSELCGLQQETPQDVGLLDLHVMFWPQRWSNDTSDSTVHYGWSTWCVNEMYLQDRLFIWINNSELPWLPVKVLWPFILTCIVCSHSRDYIRVCDVSTQLHVFTIVH